MKPRIPRGLYAITDRRLCARAGLVQSVRAALTGGAVMIQYRDKTDNSTRRQTESAALASLCHDHGALFIVNDDVPLAEACGADGVHLGRDDIDPGHARQALGSARIVGVSCYDSLSRARDAAAAGCDYVAFGSAYVSPTKPAAVHAPLSLFRRAVRELPVPVVAIGGISPHNAIPLIEAGCRAIAVISGVFGPEDPAAAAADYTRLFGE